MPELQAFLSLERSMGRLGYDSVRPALAHVESKAHAEAISGRHHNAADLIEAINLRPEVAKIESKLGFYLKSAFMLGASLAHGGLKKTPHSALKLLHPDIIDTVAKVHAEIVTLRNEQLIRRYAANVLADHQADYNTTEKGEVSHIRKEADLALADMLNNAVDGTTKMMSSISANLSTSRLVSYGFLKTADSLGVTKYQLQAVMDNRTSEICQALDGRVFEVDRALDHAERVLKTSDPESLKSVAPFLKGTKSAVGHLKRSSDKELQAEGVMVPPFHPNCRTVLVNLDSGEDFTRDDDRDSGRLFKEDVKLTSKNENHDEHGRFISGNVLKDKVSDYDLERELKDAGLLSHWYESQPNRDFEDKPTGKELLDWIKKNKKKARKNDYHDSHGQFTSAASGTAAVAARKAEWISQSKFTDIESVVTSAPANQDALVKVSQGIADSLGEGVVFKDPGIKTKTQKGIDRVIEKAPARGGINGVTDVVRTGWIINKPSDKAAILHTLSQHFEVLDEGFSRRNMDGYYDGTAMVRFKDGMIGEVQFLEPNLASVKKEGHKLYNETRGLKGSDPKVAESNAKQRKLYGDALEKADPAWKKLFS